MDWMPFWMIRIFNEHGLLIIAAAGAIIFAGAGYLYASRREHKEIPFSALDWLCVFGMVLLTAFIGWYIVADSQSAFHIEDALFSDYYYVGEVKAGEAMGRGKLFDSVTLKLHFVGIFKGNGYMKGTYTNGDRYEGNVVNGKPSGQGVYYFVNGDRYEGEYIDGKRNGQGVYYWANGDRYEGEYVGGKRNGKFVYYYADGRSEKQEWKNDAWVR